MKKCVITSILLVIFALAGFCGPLFAYSKNLHIAMILWRGETEGERGFKDGLNKLGYSVRFTTINAEQDRAVLGSLLRDKVKPKLKEFDYIYTFGTTVTKLTKLVIQNQVPHIFNAVAAPFAAGIAQRIDFTGGNISGASNRIPLSLQIDIALKVINFKKIGLLFNPREPNSLLIRKKLYKICNDLNIEVIDLRSPPAQDLLKENLRKLLYKSIVVDAVYLPLDSFMVSNAKLIGAQLRAARVKSIGSIRRYIESGVLIGVIPNYYQLGKAVAEIVDLHQRGKKLESIPIYTQKTPSVAINKTTSQALGVEVPENLFKNLVVLE